jgi:hypothetical protein
MCYLQSTTQQDRLLKQTCLLIYMLGITPQVQLQCLVHITLLGILCMDFEVYISQLAFVFLLDNVSGVAITCVFLVLLLQSSVIRNNWIPKILPPAKCILVHTLRQLNYIIQLLLVLNNY